MKAILKFSLLAALVAVPMSSAFASGPFYGGFSNGGYVAPIWHGPSVHYDRVYHPTQVHWTPGRGWHTHGHYHTVPHYTPGHFDLQHNGHVHGHPHFHH